jgi:hypothetical protein
VPIIAAISFKRQRLFGMTYFGLQNIDISAGNGLASATAASPASVSESAMMTLGTWDDTVTTTQNVSIQK